MLKEKLDTLTKREDELIQGLWAANAKIAQLEASAENQEENGKQTAKALENALVGAKQIKDWIAELKQSRQAAVTEAEAREITLTNALENANAAVEMGRSKVLMANWLAEEEVHETALTPATFTYFFSEPGECVQFKDGGVKTHSASTICSVC